MKKIFAMIVIITAVTGCAGKQYQGNGEYYQLSNRHVIYRDLTRPFSLDNAGNMETKISTPGALQQ